MVRRICKVGKGAQVENLLFYWFFCASVDVGRFLYLNKYASGLGSTNLCEGFFGLIFPTKRIFEPTVLLLKKAARCQPFLAVVRCLFHNHLRLKRSSLLNVYLNYKFEISLLTSYLFFCLFKVKLNLQRSNVNRVSIIFESDLPNLKITNFEHCQGIMDSDFASFKGVPNMGKS